MSAAHSSDGPARPGDTPDTAGESPAVSPAERASARQVVKRALRLPAAHRFRLAWRLVCSPRVPWRARLPLAGVLVYLALPIDIIPDFIPIAGQLDDLLVAGVAVWWLLRVCPPAVALEEIERLEQTPLGPIGRRLPWLLGSGLAALGLLALWWLWQRLR